MAENIDISLRRIHRDHNSAVVVLPPAVRRVMKAKVGDYVLFCSNTENGVVRISKLIPGGEPRGRGKRNSGRKNQSRRPRAKARG